MIAQHQGTPMSGLAVKSFHHRSAGGGQSFSDAIIRKTLMAAVLFITG
jgi:hypothetical protein